MSEVVVAGGGAAGMAASLTLARAGCKVTLVEADDVACGEDWHTMWERGRRGVPQLLQPHVLLPLGARLLRDRLPDVYRRLMDTGADEIEFGRKSPGGMSPEISDLPYISARRPLLEWALRMSVFQEHRIDVMSGVRITGLVGTVSRVIGLRTSAGDEITGDLVIDALGRSTRVPNWLRAMGAPPPTVSSNDSGLIYYSRYFQMHPGQSFPEGDWISTPRGDLGFALYMSFRGDNGTTAVVLGIPDWDRELRILRNEETHFAACLAIPALALLVDPSFARPITHVLPGGDIPNRFYDYGDQGEGLPEGLIPVGDSLCHTNPAFGLGLSFAFLHATQLVDTLGDRAAYFARILPDTKERFKFATEVDLDRGRLWRGEKIDFTRRDGSYPLFSFFTAGAVALRDADVFRAYVRRMGLIDRTSVLDRDENLLQRIEALFARSRADASQQVFRPSRTEFFARIEKHCG